MIIWIWLLVAVAAVVLYCRQVYSRFRRYGVRHLSEYPLVGTMLKLLIKKHHFVEDITVLYKAFPQDRFVGRYDLVTPIVVINDLELIKKITIKDFEHFLDHRSFVKVESDPIFGRNLFSLKGQEWKDMRSTLSPAFTSSKIRLMVPFMVEVGDQMKKSLVKQLQESGVNYLDIDARDLTTRYANDVIASCAFGLKVDSNVDLDNEFYIMGKETSGLTFRQIVILFIMASVPVLGKIKFPLFGDRVYNFFRHLVLDTMKDREQRNIMRPDMIHLLMEARKGILTHETKPGTDTAAGFATVEESSVGRKDVSRVWSDDDLVAQAVLFFLAGFDTVSTAMTFLLHELALNPDVQDKLVEEIREHAEKYKGKFDFNSIQQMKYMDMVVSEVLRLWTPAIVTDRFCNKDYNLGKANEKATKDYIVRKGETINIPVWAIHRDPEHFPNPNKFDPERFSEENKHNIKPFSYLPFGLGPRNCIGSRFALCEIKVMAYQLLQTMEVSPCEKTSVNSELDRSSFNLRLKGGHWLRFKIRS